MKRVLQVINSLDTGGAEKLLLDTTRLLNDKGISTDVLLLNGTDYPFFKLLKKSNCCNVYSLGNGSVYNPLNIFKLIKYLKGYDIIHVHLFPAQYFVVLANFFLSKRPIFIFTEHNTSNRRLSNFFFKIIDRQIYKFYHIIVCISEEIKMILANHTALGDEKFKVISNGVDLSIIKQAQPLDIKEISKEIALEDRLILMVAGFREQKDQKTLINAIPYVKSPSKLLLVGTGPLLDECKALVESKNLSDRVLFLGVRMDVPQLLKTAHIVVLSSHYEGLSLSSIEGMASGRPFMASKVPGLESIVTGAGILFEPGGHKDLALKINELLKDDFYYKKVAKHCSSRAEAYDIQRMVDKLINLYRNAEA